MDERGPRITLGEKRRAPARYGRLFGTLLLFGSAFLFGLLIVSGGLAVSGRGGPVGGGLFRFPGRDAGAPDRARRPGAERPDSIGLIGRMAAFFRGPGRAGNPMGAGEPPPPVDMDGDWPVPGEADAVAEAAVEAEAAVPGADESAEAGDSAGAAGSGPSGGAASSALSAAGQALEAARAVSGESGPAEGVSDKRGVAGLTPFPKGAPKRKLSKAETAALGSGDLPRRKGAPTRKEPAEPAAAAPAPEPADTSPAGPDEDVSKREIVPASPKQPSAPHGPVDYGPPPAHLQPVPNVVPVIRALARAYPKEYSEGCKGEGGHSWAFMDIVVRTLRKTNPRWGYNCKRNDCSKHSYDKIAFYAGRGSPRHNIGETRSIDFIRCNDCDCGSRQPQWLVAPWNPHTKWAAYR